MEPIPMPTRRPSTPHSMRCFACCRVTTFPPTTCSSGNSAFIHRMMSCWKVLSPWLLSTMIASTPAATKARTRSRSAGLVPMAAATMRLPFLSLVARGKSACLRKSVRATNATSRPPAVMIGNLPSFFSRRIWLALASSTPSSATARSANFFITALTCVEARLSRKSVSRLVTRPTSFDPILPSSVTGKPVKPCLRRKSSSSDRVMVGRMQIGSVMKPFLNFFTCMTSWTWASTVKFVWMTPMPPCKAIAMAILCSVTVSMGLDTMGVFNAMPLLNRESKQTSCTPNAMRPGKQIKSS
mmetsp:Transcript_74333/g.187936  ORF Transcript_74333/g.187936 Transcript_74333/m.187936 type:complete len:298 (-) Transcript_74333:299-1192(-)